MASSTQRSRGRSLLLAPLLAIAVAASTAALLADRRGVGTAYDSIVYLESARNLAAGRGLVAPERQYEASPGHDLAMRPLDHYPPLCPATLAASGVFGVDPEVGAKWLNAALFALLVVALGRAVFAATGGSTTTALLAAAAIASSHAFLRIHTMALSEPLFLLFQLAALTLLARGLERERRRELLLAAACAALAWLDRYVGATIVATGVLALLAFSRAPVRRRVVDAALFGAIATLPTVAWLVHSRLAHDSSVHRSLAWHPARPSELGLAAKYVAFWFVPENLDARVKVALLALSLPTLVVLLLLRRRRTRQAVDVATDLPGLGARSTVVWMLFAGVYASSLLLSISFVDASTDLDARALLPLQLGAVVVVARELHALQRSSGAAVRASIAGLVFLFLAPAAIAAVRFTVATREEGQGYAGRAYRESQLLERLRSFPADVPLCSNNAALVHFLVGRPARGVPVKCDPVTRRPNPEYRAQMQQLREFLSVGRGALVVWDLDESFFLASKREMLEQIDVELAFRGTGGSIYVGQR